MTASISKKIQDGTIKLLKSKLVTKVIDIQKSVFTMCERVFLYSIIFIVAVRMFQLMTKRIYHAMRFSMLMREK